MTQQLQPVERQQAAKAVQELNLCLQRTQHLGPCAVPHLERLHAEYADAGNLWGAHAIEAIIKSARS